MAHPIPFTDFTVSATSLLTCRVQGPPLGFLHPFSSWIHSSAQPASCTSSLHSNILTYSPSSIYLSRFLSLTTFFSLFLPHLSSLFLSLFFSLSPSLFSSPFLPPFLSSSLPLYLSTFLSPSLPPSLSPSLNYQFPSSLPPPLHTFMLTPSLALSLPISHNQSKHASMRSLSI